MANVTMDQIKMLRERTGAGISACKEALVEAEGNDDKAHEIIEKKGLARVAKKAGAIAAEGVIHSYIHAGSRIGVLLELNCQTDFVARNEDFKALADNIAMQIASMNAEFVRREDIPAEAIAKKREIFAAQMEEEAQTTGKRKPPEAIGKILDGKVEKWMKDVCLTEQEFFISDDKETIQQLCDKLSAKIGEKISVRRFVRYELGEGIEKKTVDFAAEVAEAIAGA
jgi:elongation factor Ts